ncbi:MAG: 50S ribosomal protein L35 [Candidatus Omnitrophica bacterium]|nr:50S ribosomal protein L35 [Candidatus Omnitrophota bacterium]HOX54942.1 50S ribosomal protein L35 [Candidatus Omnitrophota bacterium]
MSKLKTRKAVAKRIKISKSGKLKRGRAYKSHILTKKTSKRKRHLRQSALINHDDTSFIRRLLPYG